MAKRTYAAILEPNDDRREPGFGVSFPDLPGCVSFGRSVEDALISAEEALSLHLEGMAEDGDPIPEPSVITDLMLKLGDDLSRRASWATVTVETPDTAERVNVYLQKSLLERIDRHAEKEGINRSGFFNLAARQYLEGRGELVLDRESAAALRNSLAHGFSDAAENWAAIIALIQGGDVADVMGKVSKAALAGRSEGVGPNVIGSTKRAIRIDK